MVIIFDETIYGPNVDPDNFERGGGFRLGWVAKYVKMNRGATRFCYVKTGVYVDYMSGVHVDLQF